VKFQEGSVSFQYAQVYVLHINGMGHDIEYRIQQVSFFLQCLLGPHPLGNILIDTHDPDALSFRVGQRQFVDIPINPISFEIGEFTRVDKQIMETNQPHHRYGVEVTDPQGRKFLRNAYKVPLTDAQGACVGAVTINEDITERVQAQQALEKERNLLNTVLDVIPHSLVVKDKDLRYLKVNRVFQEIWQVREEDILGKTIDDMPGLSPSTRVEFKRRDKQVVETNQPHHQYELEVTDSQGQKFIRNSYRVPLADAQGACVGLVGIGEDITERVQAQQV